MGENNHCDGFLSSWVYFLIKSIEIALYLVSPNGPGVRPPPTRSTTVKSNAELSQLGGSAACRVGRLLWIDTAFDYTTSSEITLPQSEPQYPLPQFLL